MEAEHGAGKCVIGLSGGRARGRECVMEQNCSPGGNKDSEKELEPLTSPSGAGCQGPTSSRFAHAPLAPRASGLPLT